MIIFKKNSVPSVLCHCWLGIRKTIRPVKISDERGYLFAARCRLFVYDPVDATASQIHNISCLIQIQTGFTFPVPAYPGCLGQEAVEWV